MKIRTRILIYLVIILAMGIAHSIAQHWTWKSIHLYQLREHSAHEQFTALVDVKTSVHKYMKEMGDHLYTADNTIANRRFAIEVPLEELRRATYAERSILGEKLSASDDDEVDLIEEIQQILIIMEKELTQIQHHNLAGKLEESEKIYAKLSKTVFKNNFIELINNGIAEEREEIHELHQQYSQIADRGERLNILISLLALGIILMVSWFFLRDILSSLNTLSSGAIKLSEGKFDHEIPESGENEFSDLARILNTLARTIREKIDQLNLCSEQHRIAKIEAESSRKAMSEFLTNMSHEVRTPMNGIIGLTDLLLKMDIQDEKQLHFIKMVKNSANRLFRIINDILDFSRIEANRLDLESCNFSLRETITSALAPLIEQAKTKGLTVGHHIDDQIPDNLIGDPLRLTQILINLVSNSIKFTEKGGIDIFADELKRIDNNHILHFEVRDTGIGVLPEVMDKIFQAFSQAEPSVARNYGGSGLGLAISSELTKLMGGRVWVEENPESDQQGSSFHFTVRLESLPKENILTPINITPAPANNHSTEKIRILLADDEPINRILAYEILTGEGWLVTEAEDGEQALKAMQENHFDLVLMDIEMPGLDGREVTRLYRTTIEDSHSHLPIIAMTAHAIDGFDKKCLASGMDGYISKPFEVDALINLICKTLLEFGVVIPTNPA